MLLPYLSSSRLTSWPKNNKSIFLRSIDNPSISTQYTGHTAFTIVARFSPSGYYVASGDAVGTVRVWDCAGEGTTKGEYSIISGPIHDLAWDGDSQRLIAVGSGKERFGHCITADSGNTVGEISGHSSQINSVSIRQQRPLRAATGSDDTNIVFFHGAPFKFNTSLREQHDRSIYGLAFSPDGSLLVSVGADRKIWLYDGKTGEVKSQIGADGHEGSIFAVSWAKDSKSFVTSSADQTVKIWDAEAGKTTQSWRLGSEEGVISVPDHQVGVVWPSGRLDDLIISLNLVGDLTYLNKGSSKPSRIVKGHQKNVTAATISSADSSSPTLWTGGSDGRIYAWSTEDGVADAVDGQMHSNIVSSVAAAPSGDKIQSTAWDDTLRTIDAKTRVFVGGAIKTDGQPKAVALTADKRAILATHKGLELYSDSGEKLSTMPTEFSCTALAISGNTIAVGGDNEKLHFYTLSGSKLSPFQEITFSGPQITTLSFSTPVKSLLAVGFANGKITLLSAFGSEWKISHGRWSSHTGRITSIAWNKKGTHAASSSLDTAIYVWSVEKPGKRVSVMNAHKEGVNAVVWVGEEQVLSVGGDAAVKGWDVEFAS